MSKDHGLIMCADTVRALLAGLKTETRREINDRNCLVDGLRYNKRTKEQFAKLDLNSPRTRWGKPPACYGPWPNYLDVPDKHDRISHTVIPKYSVGDTIWIRETFCAKGALGLAGRIQYRADYPGGKNPSGLPWTAATFMPRRICRSERTITAVRIERLKAITKAGVLAEGTPGLDIESASEYEAHWCYRTLWEAINGKGSWERNPWVIVITFTNKS